MQSPISSGKEDKESSTQRVTQADVQQWRLQLLNGLMLTIFTIATPYLAIFLLDVSQTMPKYVGLLAMTFTPIYVIMGVTTFARRIPYLVGRAFC